MGCWRRALRNHRQMWLGWDGRAEDQIETSGFNFHFSKGWEFCGRSGEMTVITLSCVY